MNKKRPLNLGLKSLLLFSIPSIVSSMLEPLTATVDTALVGRLNTEWLAALAVATIIFSSFTWMFNFLIHASTQAVSEAFGSGDWKKVTSKIKVSLGFATVVGVGSTLLLYFIRHQLYSFAGATEEIIVFVEIYFLIRLIGHPFTLLYTTLISVLRGLTRVNVSLYLIALSTSLNVALSWLFLYKFDMGLQGVAWGSVIANVVGVVVALIVLVLVKEVRQNFFKSRVDTSHILHFGKNSFDLFGRSFTLTLSFFLCTKIAASLGTISLAAHQIMLQVWLFSSFFIDGVALTGNILGANFLAKGEIVKLRILSIRLLILGSLIGLAFSIIYFYTESQILALFTKDLLVIEVVTPIWWLLALSQFLASIAYVYDGILFGLGQFSYLRKHMIVAFVMVFLPVSMITLHKNDLIYLWTALSLLAVYRLFMGHFGVKKVIGNYYEKI